MQGVVMIIEHITPSIIVIHGDSHAINWKRTIGALGFSDRPIVTNTDPQYTEVLSNNGKDRRASGETWKSIHQDVTGIPKFLSMSERCGFWGAWFLKDQLPKCGSVHAWAKAPENAQNSRFNAFELFWSSLPRKSSKKDLIWFGFMRGGEANRRSLFHPHEKPPEVLEWTRWLLDITENDLWLDPYMGSGSAGIVAMRNRIPYIGVEREEKHFETAAARLKAEAERWT